MPKAFAWILAAVAVLVLALFGLAIGVALTTQDPPTGALDTDLEGVTVSPGDDRAAGAGAGAGAGAASATAAAGARSAPTRAGRSRRPDATLGLPARRFTWTRGLGTYIEFPPVVLRRRAVRQRLLGDDVRARRGDRQDQVDAARRRHAARRARPSTARASSSRRRTAPSRHSTGATGETRWQVQTAGKVESSPVVVDGTAYFGSHDGRLFAVRSDTGRIRWAYQTGGRINASPSVFGGRVCVTTYAGSFVCLDRRTGEEEWTTYLKRDAFRYESFYASPSSDGARLYSLSRAGTVYALDASSGRVVWRAGVGGLGYTTPAVAEGRVFAGGFDGLMRAFRADERRRALEHGRRRTAPRRARRHRPVRLLLDAREADLRAARRGRFDRLADPARQVHGRNRDRADVLPVAERPRSSRRPVATHRRPQAESRGCRRRHSGERWTSEADAFQAASRVSYQARARADRAPAVPAERTS